MGLSKIDAALKTIGVDVYRYGATVQDAPYIVWAEDGQAGALYADNHMRQQALTGTVDYYTRTADDLNVAAIQAALNGVEGLCWRLNSIQYEDDTGLLHYEWVWELTTWHA